jgi:hypothetical protein
LIENSQITSTSFDLWVNSANSVTGIDWAITSSPFLGVLASGTSTGFSSTWVTSTLATAEHQMIEQITINIPTLSLDTGTYWLQLDNAVTALPGGAFWDESDGSSQGEMMWLPSSSLEHLPDSETFRIEGNVVTPEPSSYLLLCSGLASLAGLIRRKHKA